MLNLWLFNHYAQEPGGPGGTRHFTLAKHLVATGQWEVVVIAGSIELNTGRKRISGFQLFKSEIFDGVRFIWVRVPSYHGNGLGRMLNMLTYFLLSFAVLLDRNMKRPDVVIGSSVHPLAAAAACMIGKLKRAPFIFEVRDLWPETLISLGRIERHSLIAKALRALESWLYKKAEKIIVLLPEAHRYICSIGIGREKIEWIPNGVDVSSFPYVAPGPKRANEKLKLMYFGAHGIANGLSNAISAMGILSKIRPGIVQLLLVGDGPLKADLMRQAEKMQLDDVVFLPPVPKSEIPQIAIAADMFLFNLVDTPVFEYGISSNKLFDYLAAGRPIIFCSSAANNPVAAARAGVSVGPGDPSALADAILKLATVSHEERLLMGTRGRSFVEENYSIDILGERLLRVLTEVLASKVEVCRQ